MEGLLNLVQNKQYHNIIRQCRELEADFVFSNSVNPTFYAIYILSHLLQNELPSAKAVYSRTSPPIKQDPALVFVLALLQRAWNHDNQGFYNLVSQVETGQIALEDPVSAIVLDYKRAWQARTLALLAKAYTSIPPEKAAEYLGLSSDVIPTLQAEGWIYDSENKLLVPPKLPKQRKDTSQDANFADIARLSEIAMILKDKRMTAS